MSKLTVKKAISQFTPEQLRGLILDIYSKYKDTKEYLDFFAEPDIDEAMDRYRTLLKKELFRIHRHRPTPRVSHIKAILKKFSMLEPGYEAEATLRLETMYTLIFLGKENLKSFTESQFSSIASFVADTCRFLDRNGLIEQHIADIKSRVDETSKRWLNHFYNLLIDAIQPWL